MAAVFTTLINSALFQSRERLCEKHSRFFVWHPGIERIRAR
jgi:hypothetical protein